MKIETLHCLLAFAALAWAVPAVRAEEEPAPEPAVSAPAEAVAEESGATLEALPDLPPAEEASAQPATPPPPPAEPATAPVKPSGDDELFVVPADASIGRERLLVSREIRMDGLAKRDLWLAAATMLNFGGTARQDVRVAATSANFTNGVVKGNLWGVGQGIWLRKPFEVKGETRLLASVEIYAEPAAARNARLTARTVTLGGVWDGDVKVTATELRLLPGTRVTGTLTANVETPFVVGRDVEIGELEKVEPPPAPPAGERMRERLMLGVGVFVSLYLLGWVAQLFAPMRLRMAANNVFTVPFRSYFAGLAATMAGLLLGGMLMTTGFGIAAGLFLLLELGAMGMAAPVVMAVWIGALTARMRGKTTARYAGVLATGTTVLALLTAVLGAWGLLLLWALLPLGFGALVLTMFQRPVLASPPPPGEVPPPMPPEPPMPPRDGDA